MVKNSNDDNNQEDIEITNEQNDINDPELEEVEFNEKNIISSLKERLKTCEAEKRTILEDTQRSKADFLNARKRLEDDRKRDKERLTMSHAEELIPLCDSFEIALADQDTWQKIDANWRKGMEGIYTQLRNLLQSYNVEALSPNGEIFNPYEHEAISTTPVDKEEMNDTVITVIQKGYCLKRPDQSREIIRPARVVIGLYVQN